MNGISPYNYREVTPEKERRAKLFTDIFMAVMCLAVVVNITFFHNPPTQLDSATGGMCMVGTYFFIRDFVKTLRRKA